VTGTIPAGNSATITVTLTITAPAISITGTNMANQAYTGGSSALVYTFTAFTLTNSLETISYTAKQSDGTALPSWATFTPASRSFSIYTNLTPIGFNAGSYTFWVTGSVASGSTYTITGTLVITAPAITISGTNMASQTYTGGSTALVYYFTAFTLTNSLETITYTAKNSDGTTLPTWATFSSSGLSFSVYTNLTPIGFNAGTYTFAVTGSVPSGSTATITGTLVISAPAISISGTNMAS
jgi:hypothetical protein